MRFISIASFVLQISQGRAYLLITLVVAGSALGYL
jgi:hypothetical protein